MSRSIFPTCLLLSLILSTPLKAEDEASPTVADNTTEAAPAASGEPLVIPPRTEPSPDLSRLQELVKGNSPETEILWLESSEDRTIGLYHPQSIPEALGGIIIFPSEGTHADWPDYAHPLRLHLSDHGWQTLSVQLPPPPSLRPPERTLPVLQLLSGNGSGSTEDKATEATTSETAAATQAPATVTEPIPEPQPQSPADETDRRPERPYAERIQLLADSALQALTQRGANRIIVIGVGSGAVWASQFVKDQQDNIDSLGLIIIEPTDPTTEVSPVLANLIPELNVPIVDIYQGRPSATSAFEAEPKQRLRWARRNKLGHYMQRRLSPRYADWEKQERWLSQQVDGLIRRHILEPLQETEVEEEMVQDDAKTEQGPGRITPNRPNPI
ncbi:DUF3530 family protein [Pontibacterium granulatum]|uniref:DUF3530 family protein n=1 Tax=Pontibacterium granulatum TaxID=2036029 RepID=UPI00249B55B9|nr:DUF3530 family protein [Pontibacterium granulatum]MDI3322821.1 DUF3530 family protein [Pontibacterium granulatum]